MKRIFNAILNIPNRITSPIPFGLYIINWIFQRIFRINASVRWQVHFTSKCTGKVVIGKNVWVSFAANGNCYIQGVNGVEIGDDTIFAPGVKIISANHNLKDYSMHDPAHPIKIGKNCWIGANAIILPGVQLGDNVVVGAGAVVTHNFADNSIIVGNPAKVIRVSN